MSSTVIINGRTIRIDGDCNNVCVNNNKVYVNGKLIQDCDEIKEKNIKITTSEDIEIFTALLNAKMPEWMKK